MARNRTRAPRVMGLAVAVGAGAMAMVLAVPASAGDVPAAPRSPVGEWRTSTNGVAQTISFTSDGQVSGDAGCNVFAGTYRTKGARMTIGPLATTLRACEQDVMDAEQIFLTKVQAVVSYRATARFLKLFTPKDLMTLRRG